jgi:hypothetical protein
VTLVQGDVTELDATEVGTGYQMLLDIGCFHGLTDDQRARMGRSVTAVATPDELLIMLVFRPGTRKPLRAAAPMFYVVQRSDSA